MGHNRILELFFENPSEEFQIRGIAKKTKIPKTTVNYHINKLIRKKIVIKERKRVFPSFIANESSEMYKFLKKEYSIKKIIETGLLDYIDKICNPRCVVLFGSFAKGEHDKQSDIDLFVQAKEKKINLEKFEKKLKHEINIVFKQDLKNISNELLNNIINGVKLRGFLKIR